MLWLPEKKDEAVCKFSLLLGASLPFIISFPACPAEVLSPAFPCFFWPKSVSPGCHWRRQGEAKKRKTGGLEEGRETNLWGPECQRNSLRSTRRNGPLGPDLFQPHLASLDGKMRNRRESVTHAEKASGQWVSKRLRQWEGAYQQRFCLRFCPSM